MTYKTFKSEFSSGKQPMWGLVTFLLPLIGFIIWIIVRKDKTDMDF